MTDVEIAPSSDGRDPLQPLREDFVAAFERSMDAAVVRARKKFEQALAQPVVPVERKYFTTKEVAEMLNLGIRTVQIRAGDGTLPCYQVGRQLRFPCEEILAKVEEFRRDPDDD